VDFELSDDQQALSDGVRAFLDGRLDMAGVRAYETAGSLDRDRWQEMAGTGIFGLRLAEVDGGVGLGVADAALVFEELGRHLVAGPLVATHLAAGSFPGAADGSAIVGLVDDVEDSTPVLVEHLDSLDLLVLCGPDGVRLADLDAVRGAAMPIEHPTDPLTPVHRMPAMPAGDVVISGDEAVDFAMAGTTLTAAFQAGLALRAVELSVAYAKERIQFDRPIGGFQAVKHLLADMLVAAEVARVAVYSAAVHLDDPSVGDVDRAVRAAKVVAGEAAVKCGKTAIQVHGGMGFTWEVDAHLLLKRAWVLDTHFGTADHHALALADAL